MNSNPPLRLVSLGFVCGRFDIDLMTMQEWLERHHESPVLVVNGLSLFSAEVVDRAISQLLWPDNLASSPLVHTDPEGSVQFVDDPPDDDGPEDDEGPDDAPIFRNGLNLSDLLGARNHE